MGFAACTIFGELVNLDLEGEIFTPLIRSSVSEEEFRQCSAALFFPIRMEEFKIIDISSK
jgi:hypothetical protein